MTWKCHFFGHDWEHIDTGRVCLRCQRHEILVSVGGNWGGWREIGSEERYIQYLRERRELAKRITSPEGAATE